jgi:hypothetical protein
MGLSDFQNLSVQKQQRRSRLILGASRYFARDRQIGQKGFDLGSAHRVRMPFAMKQNESPTQST